MTDPTMPKASPTMNESWVDDLAARYDDLLVEKYEETLKHGWLRRAEETGLRHRNGIPLAASLRPLFVSSTGHDALMDAASLVGQALHALAEMTRDDVDLRRAIGLHEMFDRALSLEPAAGRVPALMRLDGFSSAPGTIQFLEANAMPASFLESEVSGEFFTQAPILEELEDFRFSYARLTEHTLRQFKAAAKAERGGDVVTGFVGPSLDEDIPGHVKPLIEHLARAGVRYVMGIAAHTTLRSGRLFIGDDAVDLLMLHPYLQATLSPEGEFTAIHEAIVSGAVRMHPGSAAVFASANKGSFEVLTDVSHAHRFGRENFARLQQHVPWTRQVRPRRTTVDGREIDLLEYALTHQEDLVLKPIMGSQGFEVCLGWKVSSTDWSTALDAAMGGGYILQRRAPLSKGRSYPIIGEGGSVQWVDLLSDLNPYVWQDGLAHGALVRLSQHDILNVATGGTITPLVVAERR